VPVPRRFDRRPPERDTTRVNERIRVPEVRVIGDDGQQIGVMRTDQALRMAQERDLDLVEVAPEARPPVCRILDYSKYKYEQAQKVKQARKHQQQIVIREIKFRPKIAQHDYDTKKGHVERFLRHKDKVKITIMFRGREVTHPERGRMILDRLAEELQELAIIEQRPNLDGRNMTMMLGPSKAVLAGTLESGSDEEPADGDAPVEATETEATVDTTAEADDTTATEADAVADDDAEADDADDAEADDAEADDAEADDGEADETTDAAPADEPEDDATEAEPAADGETPAAS
jgi:translation initiation factor IF-3